MRYRISQIKLTVDSALSIGSEELKTKVIDAAAKKLNVTADCIRDIQIVRESIDARRKADIRFVYTADFSCTTDLDIDAHKELGFAPDMGYKQVAPGGLPMEHRPVIIGFGPCGMFAGLILAEAGYRPIILERGCTVEQRVADVEDFWQKGILKENSNVQFGEGGAGTFSDGKLTTGIKDPRIRKVLEEFVEAGADPVILYKQKPHIGTDALRDIVVRIRKKTEALGGRVMFNCKVEELYIDDGSVTGVLCEDGTAIPCSRIILAPGHSARDTFSMLYTKGFELRQKPFSIGVRIEHPQELINRAQYGNEAYRLSPADYKLSYKCSNGRGVYTFCMCPGGVVISAASEAGGLVTNGMSYSNRSGSKANSGLLVDVRTQDFGSEHPLAGVEFQRRYERLAFVNGGSDYRIPKTTWADFYEDAEAAAPVITALPGFAVEAIREAVPKLARKLHGFDAGDSVMYGVETRSSSPVRIVRSEELEANIKGIYPAGEGAGYAGGIVSAAVDGIKAAEVIIMKNRPVEE